jgi:hypothetical protein
LVEEVGQHGLDIGRTIKGVELVQYLQQPGGLIAPWIEVDVQVEDDVVG